MLVLNLPFKALMFLTLMRPSLVLFLVLWLKLVKDFLKVRCRLALLPFLISCLIWLDLVASLPLIKERILVIILLLHFLSLMLGSVGADASSAGMVDAGFENQKELTKMQLDNQKEIAEMQN